MNANETTNNIVDTTDCLEAVSAFKTMKNFLFVLAFICLLLLQGAFWLNDLGVVKSCRSRLDAAVASPMSANTEDSKPQPQPHISADQGQPQTPSGLDAAQNEIATHAKAAIQDSPASPQPTAETKETVKTTPADSDKDKLAGRLIPKCSHIKGLVKACNFILIITVTLYSLTLLISLKISLAGRLGGINHISRAFLISLFALVVLMPWQLCFPGAAVGTIYTPMELFHSASAAEQASIICKTLYYLRYTCLWLLEILLLLCAQIRSAKWAGATLRRLGITQ
jgi:hypothetical protein